jgi:hypothetical protein
MSGVTPYGAVGDVPVLFAIAICIGISLFFRRRRT